MKRYYQYELHTHTHECDRAACMPAADIVRNYHAVGYDGLVITDHYINRFEEKWFPDEVVGLNHQQYIDRWLRGYRCAKAEGERLGMTVLPGAEVRLDGQINDYLLYGVEEDFFYEAPRLHRCKNLEELLSLLPPEVCVVQAHPFRNNMVVADPEPLFGLEGFNGGNQPIRNEMAKMFAAHYQKPVTSGSDFHGKNRFATGGIRTEVEIRTPADLIRVLRSGEYELIENERALPFPNLK